MGNIIMTSGSDIQGFEIKEYLGLVSGQTGLTAKFFSEFAGGNSEMDEKESKELTKKLSLVHDKAVNLLEEEAIKRGANAVIGITIRYNELTSSLTNNNTIGIVATGTAVLVREKPNRKYEGVSQDLYVTNYYTKMPIRPVKVHVEADKNSTRIALTLKNYKNKEIKALRADLELTTYYGDIISLRDQDFTFGDKNNLIDLTSSKIDCEIREGDVRLIREAKVIIRKYVTSRDKVVDCDELPISTELKYHRLKVLKEHNGIDAVVKYDNNGMIWHCVCGCINKVSDEVCEVCGRKESDFAADAESDEKEKFDYDSMITEMKKKETIQEIKDLYIEKYNKSIEPDTRMEILETIASAMHFEKSRDDMKEVLLEKIQNIFEL